MTTPAAKTNATKATPAKATPAKNEEVDKPVEEGTEVQRIPTYLSESSILNSFCVNYLGILDEITEYNKAVLAEKDSEWNPGKVLEKAREFARPTDANVKPKEDIKAALEKWESLVNELARARKSVLDLTSKELGITLSNTVERNPEMEAPLKEKRKLASEIGSQLSMMAKMTTDDEAGNAVNKFLEDNPLPAIGRDQVRTFGDTGKSTPKYRVHVNVSRDGKVLLSEDGFTKTALGLTKYYERGKAPKSDSLRDAWEKAGNTPEKTVQSPVEFEDNGLLFSISKKQ